MLWVLIRFASPEELTKIILQLSSITGTHWIPLKILKIQTSEQFAVIILKFEQGGLTIEYCIQRMLLHPKDADGIANSVDPDQTAPLGAV